MLNAYWRSLFISCHFSHFYFKKFDYMACLVSFKPLPITYVKLGLCIFLSYLWFCKVDTLSFILWKFHECSRGYRFLHMFTHLLYQRFYKLEKWQVSKGPGVTIIQSYILQHVYLQSINWNFKQIWNLKTCD